MIEEELVNLYTRVKAVMEGFGWETEHYEYDGDFWEKGERSMGRCKDEPLTTDVVDVIENEIALKGFNVTSVKIGSLNGIYYRCQCEFLDQMPSAKSDTYGMAQLECAEKVLGLEEEL
jgi:hypothetical protein